MLGCYRRGEVADVEIYTRAVVAVLCGYPEAIARAVSNPARGLPSRLQWLPTVAEVRSACEAEFQPIVRRRETTARAARQIQERLALPDASQEARNRAVARWRGIREEMDLSTREAIQREREAASERLAALAATGGAALVASNELRGRLAGITREAAG